MTTEGEAMTAPDYEDQAEIIPDEVGPAFVDVEEPGEDGDDE
jgi:hypothetical protein